MSISAETDRIGFERLTGSPVLSAALIILVGLLFFLPGFFSIPPVDRDEARFAQASRQMVTSGDYVDIRLGERPRYKKPVGIYWLQSAMVSLSGQGADAPIWVYRLPSLIGAVLALLLVWQLGAVLFQPSIGLLAAMLFAATPLLSVEARLAKTDAMLLAAILAAILFLSRAWLPDKQLRTADRIGFCLAVAAATLLKGPVVFMVLACTIVPLAWIRRSLSWVRALIPVWSILLFLGLTAPWFIAIIWKSGGGFLIESLGTDLLAKAASGKEDHGAPPLTYLVAALATLWPLSLLAPAAFGGAARARRQPAVQFCLAWLIPAWLTFEIVPTKLPHYVLPLVPALALLAAKALLTAVETPSSGPWQRRFLVLIFIIPLGVLAGQIFLSVALLEGVLPIATSVLAVAAGLAIWLWFGARSAGEPTPRLVWGGMVCALMLMVGVFGLTVPSLSPLWISGKIVEVVRSDSQCRSGRVVAVGYHEPSLRFLLSRPLLLQRVRGIEAAFDEPGCQHLVVTENKREKTLAALLEAGHRLQPVGEVHGVRINGGNRIGIRVYRHVR